MAVHILMIDQDGRVLFGERANVAFGNGLLCLPGGHLEDGESAEGAAVREAREELGIALDLDDLECVHVAHFRSLDGRNGVGFYFRSSRWEGEISNCEPGKCKKLVWCAPDRILDGIPMHIELAMQHISKGIAFSFDGWGGDSPSYR